MKKNLCIIISGIMLASAGLAAEQSVSAKSKINAVTVYSDRAMVTRVTSLDLQPGIYEIKIEDVPAVILEDSVRASSKGTEVAKITGVGIKKVFLERSEDVRMKTLEAEIRQSEDKDRDLADGINVLNSKRKFLESFERYSTDKIEKEMALQKVDLQAWQSALSFFADGLADVNQKIHQTEIERRTLQEKLQALKKELQEIRASRPLEKKTISVNLEVMKAGNLEISTSYLAMDAKWFPSYDARALMKTRELEMTYYGEITQKTGEDWNDVELVLSTAKPAIGAKSPELPPWYINIYEPAPLTKFRGEAAEEMKVAVFAESRADMETVKKETLAVLETTPVSANFKIKKRENILGDGSRQKVTISVDTLKPTFDYISVPKIAENAYLKSSAVNQTGYTFVAGSVNVFQEADYIGQSSINFIVPQDTFTLDLGIDPNIKVKRELLGRNKEVGFFGKSEKISYSYKITVENFKDSQEFVTIVDHVPVSQDERIKIGIDKILPEPQEKSPQGLIKWKFALSPKEKKEILLGFTIGYPSGVVVTGVGE